VTGLSNGTNYTFQVRAVASVDGTTQAGPASGSKTANPYGPPDAPTIAWEGWSGSGGSYKGSFKVSFTNTTGRSVTVTASGSASGSFTVAAGDSGSKTVTTGTVGYSASVSISAKSTNPAGSASASKSSSSDSPAKPKPAEKLWVTQGTQQTTGGSIPGNCTSSSCHHLLLHTQNYSGAGYIYVACDDTGPVWSTGHKYNVGATDTVELMCIEGDWDGNVRALVGTDSSGNGGTSAYYDGS